MSLDLEILSRLQFALTVMFHYIFPPLTIGLGVLMVIMEGMYMKTSDPVYENMARFWTRIFAVNFAMGVTSGIVMEFQFGTNWASYSRYVGDVFGSALAAEGIFAFFLESGFLAVLVFGWDRVSARMHFLSTILVAIGATFSAVWIIVANSWQQTPAGFHIVGSGSSARAEITDFWMMVFNPSSMDRLIHSILGAYVLAAFFVMSISAYYILKDRHHEFARRSFRIALVFGTLSSLLILFSGHSQARTVSRTQPAKLAAFEGIFRTEASSTPLLLFGIPDQKAEVVHFPVAIPGLLSFLTHSDFNTPVTGLDKFPRENWPPVAVSFVSYHVMIALGVFFVALCLTGLFFLRRGTLFEKRPLLWIYVFAVAGPFIANQSGWVSAEVGRQPWLVYGLLRTSDGLSKSVEAGQVFISIILFLIIYLLLFAVWIFVLDSKIKQGPEEGGHIKHRGSFLDAAGAAGSSSLTLAKD